jgi:hypothetical protein
LAKVVIHEGMSTSNGDNITVRYTRLDTPGDARETIIKALDDSWGTAVSDYSLVRDAFAWYA